MLEVDIISFENDKITYCLLDKMPRLGYLLGNTKYLLNGIETTKEEILNHALRVTRINIECDGEKIKKIIVTD